MLSMHTLLLGVRSNLKEPRFCKTFGVFQSAIAVNLVRSGFMPSGPTLPPAKVASVMKNLDFVVDRDSIVLLICCSSFLVPASIISKSSPAKPPPSTNNSMSVLVRSPSAFAVISPKVNGAPVRTKGMRLYAK